MFQTMYQVVWQFRQDNAIFNLFGFTLTLTFTSSSPRTSFRSLKMFNTLNVWLKMTIIYNLQDVVPENILFK